MVSEVSGRATPQASPLVTIVGPTAAGKSALAVILAERLSGEVLACDSTQVYRYFDIGTAKPTLAERRGIPHHLMDLLEPDELITAGEYRRLAVAALDDVRGRGRLPIITVGTGLYLRALLEGLAEAPARSEELRARLTDRARERGFGYLHGILTRLDAIAAARIAPRDEPKLIRAIEVCLLTGKPITELHRAGSAPLEGFRPIKVGLNPSREELRERISRRTSVMIESGWQAEIDQLLTRGMSRAARPFGFIGYRELLAQHEGRMALAEAAAAITLATRRYAKRQITWFRKERAVEWFAGFGDDPRVAKTALQFVEKQLKRWEE